MEKNWFQRFRRIYFIPNTEVNAASFDKIAKLSDILYLYLTSGKSSWRSPAVAGLFWKLCQRLIILRETSPCSCFRLRKISSVNLETRKEVPPEAKSYFNVHDGLSKFLDCPWGASISAPATPKRNGWSSSFISHRNRRMAVPSPRKSLLARHEYWDKG